MKGILGLVWDGRSVWGHSSDGPFRLGAPCDSCDSVRRPVRRRWAPSPVSRLPLNLVDFSLTTPSRSSCFRAAFRYLDRSGVSVAFSAIGSTGLHAFRQERVLFLDLLIR
jgi:hypothetical protein